MDLVNNDLANTIGNLLNRTSSMSRKWFENAVPPADEAVREHHLLRDKAELTIQQVRESMQQLNFQKASQAVLQLAIDANGFLNEQAPWSQMKQPGQEVQVGQDLYAVLESSRIVGILLQPIVPDLSERILTQLGLGSVSGAWNDHLTWGRLVPASVLPKPEPVMQRLELEAPL